MAVTDTEIRRAQRAARPSRAGNIGGGETESQAQRRQLREFNRRLKNPTIGDKTRKAFNFLRKKKKKIGAKTKLIMQQAKNLIK